MPVCGEYVALRRVHCGGAECVVPEGPAVLTPCGAAVVTLACRCACEGLSERNERAAS